MDGGSSERDKRNEQNNTNIKDDFLFTFFLMSCF